MQLQQLYFVTILRVGYPDDRVLGPVGVYEGGGAVFLLRDEGGPSQEAQSSTLELEPATLSF